jgi:hypothetical protein
MIIIDNLHNHFHSLKCIMLWGLKIEDGDYQEDPCAATDPLNQVSHEIFTMSYKWDDI